MLQNFAHFLIQLYSWLIIISVLLSWFSIPLYNHPLSALQRLVLTLTAPAYRLLARTGIPTQFGAFDFAPLIIYFALLLLDRVVLGVF